MRDDIFTSAKEVIEAIESAGFQAYIVGGAVRDHLLNQPVHDIDLATSAKPQDIQAIFKNVIPVGIEHGTVIVRYLKQSFEVTTFRQEEGYSDFRHPDRVAFVDSITTDLSRRDFTINAIAMTKDGLFIDPFNGRIDLNNRIIRAVGTPVERFNEDPLRILRAIRFVSQLNFEIEQLTWNDLKENAELIEKLSIERVTAEFDKLMKGKAVKKAIQSSHNADLFHYLPIFKTEPQLVKQLLMVDEPFEQIIDLFCYLYLCTNGSLSIDNWCKAYRLSNKALREGQLLINLVELWKKGGLTPWLVYQLPENLTSRFVQLLERLFDRPVSENELNEIRGALAIEKRQDINFDGYDLLTLYNNRRAGSWMSQYLAEIERQIVDHQLNNDYDQIKEWIRTCHPPENR